jgi:hypothetical protein
MLAALDAVVSAHLLTAAPEGLAFTHEFVRQAAASPACGTRDRPAGRDDARMRRRLRKLGIRRRHWSTGKRPATGWESLTDTELATSRLVA